jgi:hypothetical protein
MKLGTIALLFVVASAGANAAPVYRCGNTYSQTPCPDGKIVEATDVRSAAQRAEARRVAADEHRLAAQMKHDRLAEEAAIKPAGAASLSEPPTAAASGGNGHLAGKKKKASAKSKSTAVKSTTDFVAIDPSTRKPGRKH